MYKKTISNEIFKIDCKTAYVLRLGKEQEMKSEIYQRVTDQIIADLEKGELTWLTPWSAGGGKRLIELPERHDGTRYQGVNILMLWMAASRGGFSSPIWMTYRQAIGYGAHVRTGEQGSTIVYANTYKNFMVNEKGEEEEQHVPFLRHYTVFNVDQIEDLPTRFYATKAANLSPKARIQHADRFFSSLGADIQHGTLDAFYSPKKDQIYVPEFELFHYPEAYYATLAHEVIHWTSHNSRLNRDCRKSQGDDEGYAREELVAELGAAFLCADMSLKPQPSADHAAYIQGWLKIFRNDKRAIFSAAAHAQRAVNYLHKLASKNGKNDHSHCRLAA